MHQLLILPSQLFISKCNSFSQQYKYNVKRDIPRGQDYQENQFMPRLKTISSGVTHLHEQ